MPVETPAAAPSAAPVTTQTPPAAAAPAAAPASAAPETPAAPAAPVRPDPRAAFAQRERDLVKKSQELSGAQKAHEERVKADEARLAKAAEMEKLASRAKADPDAVAKHLWGEGYYDQFTQMRLAGARTTPEFVAQLAEEKAAAVEERVTARFKAEREAEQAARAQQMEAEAAQLHEALGYDVDSFIEGSGDEYELTKLYNGRNMVLGVMNDHAAKTGRALSIKEAVAEVEKQLNDTLSRFQKTKKFQALLPPAPSSAPPAPAAESPKTITDRLTPITPGPEAATPFDPDEHQRRVVERVKAEKRARAAQAQ